MGDCARAGVAKPLISLALEGESIAITQVGQAQQHCVTGKHTEAAQDPGSIPSVSYLLLVTSGYRADIGAHGRSQGHLARLPSCAINPAPTDRDPNRKTWRRFSKATQRAVTWPHPIPFPRSHPCVQSSLFVLCRATPLRTGVTSLCPEMEGTACGSRIPHLSPLPCVVRILAARHLTGEHRVREEQLRRLAGEEDNLRRRKQRIEDTLRSQVLLDLFRPC